jgi:hypothetical protein
MPKLPECDRCQLSAHSNYLVCAIHPEGPEGNECLDFAPVAGSEEQWQPLGGSYYNGELICDWTHYLTTQERLELLDTHPLFTGLCPNCEVPIRETTPPRVHWDCPECGWLDDVRFVPTRKAIRLIR